YTYALNPFGAWAQEAFHLSRNHYDRIGPLALGFFPALTIREVLLRRTPLQRGGWLVFIILSIVLAIGAFWELVEWWTTLIVASDVGQAFLGSQGDIWDAQWDMLLALVGAAIALPLLSGVHDRSMASTPVVTSCDVTRGRRGEGRSRVPCRRAEASNGRVELDRAHRQRPAHP